MNLTQEYLNKEVDFGGVKTTLGKVVETLQSEGTPQKYIDAYIRGTLTAKEIHSLMEWKMVVVDETEHWVDYVVKLADKIFGVYVFDPGKQTYLCEMTPSFDMKFIKYEPTGCPEDQRENEILWEYLTEQGDDSDMYMHCTDVTPIQVNTGLKLSEFNGDEIREELLSNGLPEAAQKLIK